MEWATVLLFLVLGISSLIASRKKTGNANNVLLRNNVNRFWLGLSMSAINPIQLPFWFLWSSYLFSIKLLQPDAIHFNIYTAGIGCGTILGLLLFVYGGKWLVNKINASQKAIHIAVAIVFLFSAAIQLVRVLNKPLKERFNTSSSAIPIR